MRLVDKIPLLFLAAWSCSAPAEPPALASEAQGLGRAGWAAERARRQAELDRYLATNAEALRAFMNTPLGHTGFPVLMMRVFPEIFPEIWAPGGDASLGVLGFGAHPFAPDSILPFGLGYSVNRPPLVPFTSIGVQVANLTCGACHVGRVEGPEGRILNLVGAPNGQFDASGFFAALEATVVDPDYRVEVFAAAIAAHAPGYFYGGGAMRAQERLERGLFSLAGGRIVDAVAAGIRDNQAARARVAAQSYSASGAPSFQARTPGRADAFGLTMAQFVDDATASALPDEPAITDIMSIWRQSDRVVSHWGGEMKPGVWPVVAAELAVAGNAEAVNVENIAPITRLIAELPPPPYPFDVDLERAGRGSQLFERACAGCHQAGVGTVYPAAEVGTDASRSRAFEPYTLERFNGALRAACLDRALCDDAAGDAVAATGGYVAPPLDGVWARAPYLHNGSVPTLYHLLVPASRPATFERGSLAFDQEKVGFVWDAPGARTTTYDTRLLGGRNGGHDTPEYLGGIDWASEPESLADLLEYLKTM